MNKKEVKNNQKWEAQDYFIYLVLQAKDIPIWKTNETKIQNMCTRRNSTMGS